MTDRLHLNLWPHRSRDRLFRVTPTLRFSVYLKSQEPVSDAAAHEISRELAREIVRALYARAVGQNAIQLTVDEPWKTVKMRVRTPRSSRLPVPVIKPPRRPENLLLYYPIRDQRTCA